MIAIYQPDATPLAHWELQRALYERALEICASQLRIRRQLLQLREAAYERLDALDALRVRISDTEIRA